MTSNQVALKGQMDHLPDGTPVLLWIEQDPQTITVLVTDEHGQDVAHARARRPTAAHRPSAQLQVRTEPQLRRRGVARLALNTLMEWAQDHDVPFLVVDVPVTHAAGRAFLLGCGYAVAVRTSGDTSRFAIQVPAGAPRRSPGDTDDALARAEVALEAGASLNEAEALFDRLLESARQHPAAA